MARVSIIVRIGITMDITIVTMDMVMDTVIAIAIAIAVAMGMGMGMGTTIDTIDTTAVTRDITVMKGARGEVDDPVHALCGGYRGFFRSTG